MQNTVILTSDELPLPEPLPPPMDPKEGSSRIQNLPNLMIGEPGKTT